MFRKTERGEFAEGPPWCAIAARAWQSPSLWTQMEVALSDTVARHIGVRREGFVSVAIGTMSDVGWIQLRRSPDGQKVQTRDNSGTSRIRFSGKRLGVGEPHLQERMKFRLGSDAEGNFVNALLPRWAWLEQDNGSERAVCPTCGGFGTLDEEEA